MREGRARAPAETVRLLWRRRFAVAKETVLCERAGRASLSSVDEGEGGCSARIGGVAVARNPIAVASDGGKTVPAGEGRAALSRRSEAKTDARPLETCQA